MTINRLNTAALLILIPLWFSWILLPAKAESPSEGVNAVVKTVQPAKPKKAKVKNEDAGLYDRDKLAATLILKPADSFWDELARCETASDWQNPGRYAGGLGIMTSGEFRQSSSGTWERWGGEEFAPSPDQATREEQIIIANRIAVWGWSKTVERDPEWARVNGVPVVYEYVRPPVGFYGWGALHCAGGKPDEFYHYNEPEKLLLVKYEWLEESMAVRDLQVLMGFEVPTGIYDIYTRAKHLEILDTYGMVKRGVPKIPEMASSAAFSPEKAEAILD